MFDFENLEVYKKAKTFNAVVGKSVLKIESLDGVTKNQLGRASLSVVLNIADGTSRFSQPDRKNFCVIARGSVFECVAVFDILRDNGQLTITEFSNLYSLTEEMSKMMFAVIWNLEG